MLPNRVGLPRNKPSQLFKSSSVANKAPESGIISSDFSVSVLTSGTVLIFASAPSIEFIPRAM